jgi:hypothetical protein
MGQDCARDAHQGSLGRCGRCLPQGNLLPFLYTFLDCIELHKLTIFPVDAAEKQHYYMTQTDKKPQ